MLLIVSHLDDRCEHTASFRSKGMCVTYSFWCKASSKERCSLHSLLQYLVTLTEAWAWSEHSDALTSSACRPPLGPQLPALTHISLQPGWAEQGQSGKWGGRGLSQALMWVLTPSWAFFPALWAGRASQLALVVKNLLSKARDMRNVGPIPGWGRPPGGGHGNPLQYSCLENPMDRGA